METTDEIKQLARLWSVATNQEVNPDDPESMIGAIQKIRPEGDGLEKLFESVPNGGELVERLKRVFKVTGDGRRPDGMVDAYFIVRDPAAIDPDHAEELAIQYWQNLFELAKETGLSELAEQFDTMPTVRVMEGKAPKHPRAAGEKSSLLAAVQSAGPLLNQAELDASSHGRFLREAYYFIACDWKLRDYLMWPLIAHRTALDDPFHPYFVLWSHGIKYRIFNNRQIDIYLPRVFTDV